MSQVRPASKVAYLETVVYTAAPSTTAAHHLANPFRIPQQRRVSPDNSSRRPLSLNAPLPIVNVSLQRAKTQSPAAFRPAQAPATSCAVARKVNALRTHGDVYRQREALMPIRSHASAPRKQSRIPEKRVISSEIPSRTHSRLSVDTHRQ